MATATILLYIVIAACCTTATFKEGQAAGAGWTLARVAGLTLSLFWPALIILLLAIVAYKGLSRDGVREPLHA